MTVRGDIDQPVTSSLVRRAAAGCGALGCSLIAVVIVGIVAVVGLAIAGIHYLHELEAYAEYEHEHWPRNTRVQALRTRAPGGGFTTSASYDPGYADLANARAPIEDVLVRASRCGDASVSVSTQFHATCQERVDLGGCGQPDGRLLHERFGVRVQWLDDARLAVSWTELASLDRDGHRVWTREREVHRFRMRAITPGGSPPDGCERCANGDYALCVDRIE